MLPTIVPPHRYLTRANALNNTATWQPVLRRTVLRSEVYTIPADSQNSREPHQEDELYYVLAGSAMIQIAGVDTHVHPGSLIFVPAGAWHHYHSLAGDLSLLVAFAAIPSVALFTAGNRNSSALVISPGQVVPPRANCARSATGSWCARPSCPPGSTSCPPIPAITRRRTPTTSCTT